MKGITRLKGIFDTKANSGYDDEIVKRYHFPSIYLRKIADSVGDWIIYREPQRNGGRRAYVAVAHVDGIQPDPNLPGHSYAIVSQFLPFDRPVPFAGSEGYREQALRDIADRNRVGAYLQGKSVRHVSEDDFSRIVRAGLGQTLTDDGFFADSDMRDEDAEHLLSAPPAEQERRIQQILVNRKIRDINFRRQVCQAYDNRCAVTGLKILDSKGRAEVQGAHIVPVSENGPDVVQNGLALCGTAHWLFDRHMISLTEEYRLLVSHNTIPSEFRDLFERQMDRIHLPKDRSLWPHPAYIERHRDAFFR